MTPDQVRAFQRIRRNHLGQALDVDGDIGPQTQWALDVEALGARGRIINAALDEVGLLEQGVNRGPKIDLWNARCGVPMGSPWCAAFASACVSAGGVNLHTASVAALVRTLTRTLTPRPGDLGCWLNADGTGHVWVWTCFDAMQTEGYTVEGNTDSGVRVWTRNVAEFISLVTIPEPPTLVGLPKPRPPFKARGGQTR